MMNLNDMNVQALFEAYFGEPPELLGWSPGRVNLLGEHVDYNDGLVLPAAIDRAVRLAASPAPDGVVTLVAQDLDERASFRLSELNTRVDVRGEPLPKWALYPASVAWSLGQAGLTIQGLKAVFTSDIPIGAGLSSSAAVEIGFALAWQALGDWQTDRMNLARLSQRGENEYVGVASGLMDQFTCAHGIAGQALFFDTRSLDWQPAPLPSNTVLVIADSGVRRSLAESEYNQRRADCEQAVLLLQEYLPDLRSLRDISPIELAAFGIHLPPVIRRRAEHVVKEIARVQSAFSALKREDARSFGALMFAGHASLRDLYEVSTPELDALVDIAHELPGCLGARLTGAGFGGCTVNLVEAASAQDFIQGLQDAYLERTGRAAKVYLCQASSGASIKKIAG
jgi:galactokinase